MDSFPFLLPSLAGACYLHSQEQLSFFHMMIYFIMARDLLRGAHNVVGAHGKFRILYLFMLIERTEESNSFGDLQSNFTDLRSHFDNLRSSFKGNSIIPSVRVNLKFYH